MRQQLLPILACPVCRGGLGFRGEATAERLVSGALSCGACGRTYPVRDELAILKDLDQSAGEWEWKVDVSQPEEFEAVQRGYDEALPEEVRQARASMVEHLLGAAADSVGPILDVATGMGTLFRPLAARLDSCQEARPDCCCVACDVDERVLRGTQLRLHHEGHARAASFCVTDAKHLAVQDDVIGAVVSFGGFANIPEGPSALREAARVLRPGGALAFSTLLLREGSPSLEMATRLGYAPLMTAEGVLAALSATGLRLCDQREFVSGIWPACPYDLLPVEGDCFAHAAFLSRKPNSCDA
jgi:ubiquinone/menaquinone biosynthesis C-methylase UbiE/uncharacterized protein YbaR (Trm112 family)